VSATLQIVAGLLTLCGAGFALIAALGVLRLPDLYMRMHAASKAGTLGSGLLLVALAVDAGELDVTTRAVAGVVFLLLTAPISAHLLARAAYFAGVRPHPSTSPDDLAGHRGEIKQS
jgi:multicomponent Na+:H+ antiporter subunit G